MKVRGDSCVHVAYNGINLAKELEAEVAKASNKISKTAAAIDRMLDDKDSKENAGE